MKLINTIQQTEKQEFYTYFKHLLLEKGYRLKTLCELPESTIKDTQAHYFLKAKLIDLSKVNSLLKPLKIELKLEASNTVVIKTIAL
jgi:hypothetical protein